LPLFVFREDIFEFVLVLFGKKFCLFVYIYKTVYNPAGYLHLKCNGKRSVNKLYRVFLKHGAKMKMFVDITKKLSVLPVCDILQQSYSNNNLSTK